MSVQSPHVNMNGTSLKVLSEDYLSALEAVRVALQALHQVAPNGRDYLDGFGESFKEARNQHVARVAKLVNVESELSHILAAIAY